MDIKYIRVDSELGAGTRGASLGYLAMRVAGHNKGSALLNKYPTIVVKNSNELLYTPVETPNAKYIEGVVDVLDRAAFSIEQVIREGNFAMVFSGDHSVAAGTIAGIKRAFPEKRLGVVWIDAHADLHSPYSTPSGNVHGMPLGAALGYDHINHQVNELSEAEVKGWEKMKSLGYTVPCVQAHDVVYFGVRDLEDAERHFIRENHIKNYTVEEIRYRGMNVCMREAIDRLAECDMIYISFDVDSMDCHLVSKGTGTPVAKGFDPEEVRAIIKTLLQTGKVVAMETVEINPTLDDKQNTMAETAFDTLAKVIPYIEKQ